MYNKKNWSGVTNDQMFPMRIKRSKQHIHILAQ